MEPIIECGIARNPGDAMAWSDGEVSLGPVIDTTHGKLVIDGPICYYGCPTTPVELRIEKGRIVEVVGGDPKICKEIRRQIAEVKDSDNIAEIGLGLNPARMFNGDFEEEKKARGTCTSQWATASTMTAGTLDRTYRHGTVQSDRYLRRGNTRRGSDCKRRQGCMPGR